MASPSMTSKLPERMSSGSKSPATNVHQMDVDVDSPSAQRDSFISPSPSTSRAAPVAKRDPAFLEQELIPESSRLTRLPHEVPLSLNTSDVTPTAIAISAHQNNTHNTYSGQDVHFSVNNPTSLSSSSVSRNFGQPSNLPGTSVSSFSQPLTQHVINHPIRRPRTSTKVFESTTDLAAHYGIPQILPPLPRTTPRYNAQQPTRAPQSFESLKSNYLSMLSKKPTETTMTSYSASTTTQPAAEVSAPAAFDASAAPETLSPDDLQKIVDIIAASPQFRDQDFLEHDWMTSPLIPDLDNTTEYGVSPNETPFDDFLDTPLWTDQAMLTSPNMDYYGEFDMNQPLISGPEPPYEEVLIKASGSGFDNLSKESQPAPPNFDALIAFSPQTQLADSFAPTTFSPAIATTQLPQQLSTSSASVAPGPNSRRHKPTGHRQGVTPDDLLPEDAPTQPRRYMGPSATSKKEIPATFARKRSRSVAFGEDDEVIELPPNPTEQQLIEAKRRQNTVAARRSRKRKLEQHANLLASRDEERFFKQRWELRARDLMRLLQEKGIHVPDFPPDEPKYADAC